MTIHNSFKKIKVHHENGVAYVTIDNPPVNVLDVPLMSELWHFLFRSREDASAKVIVFESANPDFFISHVDMTLVDEPDAFDELKQNVPNGLNVFQAFSELIRHQPQVTIVKLAGIARGGGAEFVAAADMAFAAIGHAGLDQCEALMGIVPGGGGTQYTAHRLGRNRALEVILGADLLEAETLERYGWVNRALPMAALDPFVDRLARNIASLPDGVIATAKLALPPVDLNDGFARENDAWARLFALPDASRLIRSALASGAQTPEGEKGLETLLRKLL